MKQMSLIEMDGFLKGKYIPRDLKVNETNAEYLVRKFAEAEAKISALSEDQQRAIESIKQADSAVKLAHEKFSALAAENAALKAGAMYFSYGSEFSFECHKTAEEAIAAAEAAIDDYRGDACDGWSEEVESICWGVIIQQATKVGERKKRKCDRVSPWIERVCDYELRPNVETPATDAFLDEIERKAIRKFINSIEHILRDKLSPYDTEEMLEAMRIFLEEQGGEQK
ncbi:TPA: hypothetical protein HMU59_01605 [Escherichia coli]|nr:hypothetical protein [Escherichia coli]